MVTLAEAFRAVRTEKAYGKHADMSAWATALIKRTGLAKLVTSNAGVRDAVIKLVADEVPGLSQRQVADVAGTNQSAVKRQQQGQQSGQGTNGHGGARTRQTKSATDKAVEALEAVVPSDKPIGEVSTDELKRISLEALRVFISARNKWLELDADGANAVLSMATVTAAIAGTKAEKSVGAGRA